MPDYNKGCIYKIKKQDDYEDDCIYIGSTCNFTRRKCDHKNKCNDNKSKKYNYRVYSYIRDNGGWDNFIMIEINKYECLDKRELEIEERRVIDKLKPKLNYLIPTRTKKERYETDEEYRNKIKQQRVDRYIKDKDVNLEKSKKNYYDNKETKINYSRDYYKKKKDELKVPIECDNCGKYVSKYCLAGHKKSNYCINFNKNN